MLGSDGSACNMYVLPIGSGIACVVQAVTLDMKLLCLLMISALTS